MQPILPFILALGAVGKQVVAQFHPNERATYPKLPCLRDQATILDNWTMERLGHVPQLMSKYGVGAWLMSQREHAEDTVFWSIKPATTFAARRRTVYLFHDESKTALSDKPNPLLWIDNTPQVWTDLRNVLELYDPSTIALNIDPDLAFADGMHAGELERVREQLGEKWMSKVVRRPMLATEFVARRIPEQLEYYKKLQGMAWAMVSEAFSERTITPGVTTTDDVAWWFRDQMQAHNVSTWNMPRVSIYRQSTLPNSKIIEEGDMLHTDFGITFLGLNTDTQHLGYVLRTSQGETDVPEGLKKGISTSNRLQDIVREKMRPGKTGNEVLQECLDQMEMEKIAGQVYCHPIGERAKVFKPGDSLSVRQGDRGHAPGSLIGMNDLPYNVPVLGDLPILPQTYYSVELFASQFVPEWNETVNFMQEENVYWSDETMGWEWVWGRQEHFHLVHSGENVVPVGGLRVQSP